MGEDIGLQLRRRREQLGLDLDQVSEGIGVPRDYLEALEAGEMRRLPPGPYATAYVRTYRLYLQRMSQRSDDDASTLTLEPSTWGTGVPPTPVPTPEGDDGLPMRDPVVRTRPVPQPKRAAPEPSAPPRVALPAVRAIAALAMIAFLSVFIIAARGELGRWSAVASQRGPVVEVQVLLMRNAKLRVWIDGALREDRVYSGSDVVRFLGRERVEVEVPGIEDVKFWFGEREVAPLGRRSTPRRLVFLAAPGSNG